jgi:Protein of unknown function (DUF3313)
MRYPTLTALKAVVLLIFVLLTSCGEQPVIERGDDSVIVGENLHKVSHAKADIVFIDPDTNFSNYKSILLAPLSMKNTEIIQPSGYSRSRDKWVLTQKDKEKLAEEYRKSLIRYLQKDNNGRPGYRLVDKPGPGVLYLASTIITIAPTAPKDDFKSRPAGRSKIFTEGAGAITIGLEIKDAETGKDLVRAVDQRDSWSSFRLNNRVSNLSDVRLMFNGWANMVRHGLDNVGNIK